MTSHDGDEMALPPLPPDIAEVMARGGDYPDGPALAVRGRLRARLLKNGLPGPGTSSDGGQPTAPPVTGPTGLAVLAKPIGLALVTYALGVASGLGLHARRAANPPPSAATPVASRPASPAVALPPPDGAPAPSPVTCSCPSVAPGRAGADGAADGGLGRERALLDQARTALMNGDARSALAALDRHRRAFPEGRLEEERDVLRVQGLLASGRATEAHLRRHASCGSTPLACSALPSSRRWEVRLPPTDDERRIFVLLPITGREMIMKTSICLLVLCSAAGCSQRQDLAGSSDAGSVVTHLPSQTCSAPASPVDAGTPAPIVAVWEGYMEQAFRATGSDKVHVVVRSSSTGELSGTAVFGNPPPPPTTPATSDSCDPLDQTEANPLLQEPLSELVEGFEYQLTGLAMSDVRLQFRVENAQPLASWCACQPPVADSTTCIPNVPAELLNPVTTGATCLLHGGTLKRPGPSRLPAAACNGA